MARGAKRPGMTDGERIDAFALMRQTWHEASQAQLALEEQGRPTTPADVWKALGNEEPPPRVFLSALESESYSQLLDIRRRTLVIPDLEKIGVLRGLAAKGAYMALTSALEDLATMPGRISVSEKRQVAKTFMEMNLRLKGVDEVADVLLDSALDEEKQMEEALKLIPEEMQPRMRQIYKEERIKALRDRSSLHLIREAEDLGHANTG